MKKKLMGLLAAVLTVSMTTSAFAAETGFRKFIDENFGDGSGTFSANDIYLVEKKLNEYVAAGTKPEDYDVKIDVDSNGTFDTADIKWLYQLALRPNDVYVAKTIRVTAKGVRNVWGTNPITKGFVSRKNLGYEDLATKVPDDYGTEVYVFNGSGGTVDQIKIDTYDTVKKFPDEFNATLDKVSFYSAALNKNIALRSEEGWARLCVALRYVIPVELDDVLLASATPADAQRYVDESTAFLGEAGNDGRKETWNYIKDIIVGNEAITVAQIDDLEKYSNDLSAYVLDDGELANDEITKTATEVMNMVGSKYPKFTVKYNGSTLGEETISADGTIDGTVAIADSELIKGLIAIKDAYADPNVKDTVNVATVANAYKFGTVNAEGKLELTGDENIVVEATNASGVTTTVNVFLADTLVAN